MKNNIIIGLILLWFAIGCAKKNDYNFLSSEEEVQHTNKSTKSVIYFTSDYCIPCIKMKKIVWPNSKVQETINSYHNSPWMLNGSEPDDADQFYKYKIEYVPTTIIIDHNQKEVKRHVGYMRVDELLEFLK